MAKYLDWDSMYVQFRTDDLLDLHKAIAEWGSHAASKLDKAIETYKENHGEPPEDLWDHFGGEASTIEKTRRIMCAGLAVAIASCAENVVEAYCKRENLAFVKKNGQPIDKPTWGQKKAVLEKHLKVKFETLNGFAGNRRARLLGNCHKHSDDRVDKELAKLPGFTLGHEIDYEKQNWVQMIDDTRQFLFELVKLMLMPPDPLDNIG